MVSADPSRPPLPLDAGRTIEVLWHAAAAAAPAVIRTCYPGLAVAVGDPPSAPGGFGEVAVLDARAFLTPEALLQARAALPLPTLFLVDEAQVELVLGGLEEGDDLLLHGAPPALLAFRVQQIAQRALDLTDGLTRLGRRRALLQRLEEGLTTASEAAPLSVLLVDIDHFKRVNDELGHAVGDQVLRELAARVAASCPPGAFPARFSGERIAVLLREDEPAAVAHGELIREAARRHPFVLDAPPAAEREPGAAPGVPLTVSVGAATAHVPGPSRELLRQLEEALYAAKARGRDRTVHFSELEREALRRDDDIDLFAFENMTRVIAERVAEVITRRGRRLFREIKQQADVDALTGLYSRRYLDRRLAFEVGEASRGAAPLTLAMVDLDFFGRVNKEHGWPAGDAVLAGLARVLRQSVRSKDWVARYGGEEFCLVLAGTPLAVSGVVLERVRHAVADHVFAVGELALRLTVSIGAAERLAEESTAEPLLQRASNQLLEAKRGGRDRVCL